MPGKHVNGMDGESMTAMSRRADRRHDVVIVGAGMAGLLAADTLARLRPASDVLVVDAGRAMAARERYSSGDWGGYGGAGLFLGGRVYIGPAAIPVLPPTTLPAGIAPILDGEAYVARAREVNTLLDTLGASAPLREVPNERLQAAMDAAASAGLEYVTSYPARFLSIDERLAVLRGLRQRLEESGVRFRFETSVTSVERAEDGYRLRLAAAGRADRGDTDGET